MNRYYAGTYGRFSTADPYQASGGPSSPASWNRYSYTRGDPVNRIDRAGTCDTDPDSGLGSSFLLDTGSGTEGGCDNDYTGIGSSAQTCLAVGLAFDPNTNECAEPTEAPPSTPAATPSCTIDVYNRPVEATHGVNLPGAQHAFIEIIDANGLPDFAEGQKSVTKSGAVLTAVAGPNGVQLPGDIPYQDHLDGSLSGPQVCGWLSILQSDASKINAAKINYHWYGPNSSSVLAYMLKSLPTTPKPWFTLPWLVGYGTSLPGVK